tara:strand:- start:109 stop:696 length:588 start_codon:yes stop_codon:yes gene_type:complete
MGFWSQREIEPKRKFRWLLEIPNLGPEASWMAKSVTKPSWNMSEHPHKFINHTFHYPGRVEWQPVEVTLVDVANPIDMGASFLKILRSGGYNWPTSLEAGSQTITKERAVDALGGLVFIKQIGLDSTKSIDCWALANPFITDVKTGDLDYEGEDLVEVSCTIVYDYAYMTTSGGMPGTAGGALEIPAPPSSGDFD